MYSQRYILNNKVPIKEYNQFIWENWWDNENRQVAYDKINDRLRVSTIFLGRDYNNGQPPSLFFETVIIGGPQHGEQAFYSTWEQAEKGHARIADTLSKKKGCSIANTILKLLGWRSERR